MTDVQEDQMVGNVEGILRVSNLEDVTLVQLTGEAVELYGLAFGTA